MSNPFGHFQYHDGTLCAEELPVPSIIEEVGTPAYIYSSAALLEPLRVLQEGLKEIDHLVCFAVKSNSNIAILKLLADSGAGMDLVSGGELYRALHAGTPSNRIVFSGVGKTSDEMALALENGIASFNVESVAELSLLNEVAIGRKSHATVALRFNPDVDAKTHPYISTGLKKNKFGLNRKEILEIAKNHRQFPGIRFHGLSSHIGSQLLSLSPLNDAFIRVRALVEELNEILPEPLNFVDLGGGVGITYKNERPPTLQRYCQTILKHFGPKARLKSPLRVFIEPGRSISGNAGILVSKVLYKKERGAKDFLIIDAGMNDLIRPALYSSHHQIVPVLRARGTAKLRKMDIVGPVCESSDCFASNRPISSRLAPQDLIAILSSGAYGFTMSSNYNSRPRPVEVLVEGNKFRVVRDRETYPDLIRGEHL